LAWWLGDALSVLIITPLLLTFHHLARQWRAKEVLEFIIFNFCTVVIGLVVFSNFIFHIQRVYPHAFLIFPLPIWVALRFRPPETAWGVFLLSVTASWGTAKGLGPFSGLSPSDRLILLQAFMGVVAVTALILCAAVTERTRSMNRTEFLSQASIILASSMNYEETLKTVSQLAVPELTDWCLVDILEDDGRIQRLAVSHADRTQASLASQLKSFSADLSSPDGIAKVIRTQQPLTESFASQKLKEPLHKLERVTDRSGALLSVSDPDQLKVIDKLSFKSYMSVPLLARDRILGALTFISVGSANPYCNEDLKVAQELARRSALAIDNSKLYKEVQKGIILRDDFISIASHELRTPLTSLKMQIHLMRQRLRTFLSLKNSSQDQLFKLLENSDRQVERLNHLIENVLNVSKITTGQLTLDKTEVDLTQLIRDILDGFELQVKLAKCTVLLEVQSNAKGKWDLIRIEEVVINLLTNAMKYGAGNPIQIQISSQDDWIAIAVQDYGVGISEADQKRIFNRFERVSSVKNIGGLGLGLYITREIIQAHGGFIEVKSELGKGSTFIVHLPLT
jgi:signal transduction histidine kinase